MWSFVDAIKQNLDEVAGIGKKHDHAQQHDNEEEQDQEEQQQQQEPEQVDDEQQEHEQEAERQQLQLHARTLEAQPQQILQQPPPNVAEDEQQVVHEAHAQSQSQPQQSSEEDLRREVIALRAQSTRIAAAMGETETLCQRRGEEIAELKRRLEHQAQQHHAALQAASQQQQSQQNLKHTSQVAQQQLQQSQEQVQQLQQLVEQLKKEGLDMSKQLGKERERAKTLVGDKKQLEDKIAELDDAVSRITTQLNAERNTSESLRKAAQKHTSEIADLQRQLAEKQQAESRTVEELQAAGQRRVEAESKEKELLEEKLRETQRALQELQDSYDELQSQRDALAQQSRSALIAAETRVSQLERQVSALSLRADMAESRAIESSSGMSDTMAEWGARVRQSEQLLEQSNAKNAVLERNYAAAMQQIGALTSQCEQVRQQEELRAEQLRQLSEQIAAGKRAVDAETRKTAAANSRVEELERELRRQQQQHVTEISRMQTEMLELARSPARVVVASPATAGSSSPDATAKQQQLQHQDQQQQKQLSQLLSSPTSLSGTNGGGGSRVEKELARVSAHLSDERAARSRAESELRRIRVEYDVLLQLHGELLEQQQQTQQQQPNK